MVIVIHPKLESSKVNKRWIEEIQKYPQLFDIHILHEQYADGNIDVAKEQSLVEKYDKIVFQFPYYWFNCPPLFKKWLDEVLTYGWAFGSNSGYKLQDKKIGLAISVGSPSEFYTPSGHYAHNLQELLLPFQLSFEYVKAKYAEPFASYGFEIHMQEEFVEESVAPYINYMKNF